MEAKKPKNNYFTFEQLCIHREYGFALDEENIFIPLNDKTFDDIVFKLICKINTSLLLLNTHGDDVECFTLIAIPLSQPQQTSNPKVKSYQKRRSMKIQPSQPLALDSTVLEDAWEYLSSVGWHCLHSLALLQPDSIPDNGARKYSLYQFTTSIMDMIRANYMFQKYADNFHHETLEMFDETEMVDSKQVIFGLLWKRAASSLKQKKGISVLMSKRSYPTVISEVVEKKKKSVAPREVPEETSDSDSSSSMNVDEEISFKPSNYNYPKKNLEEEKTVVPEPTCSPKSRTKVSKEVDQPPSSVANIDQPPSSVANIDLNASVNTPKKGRKSMVGRKSLSSEWSEEDRQSILQLFDDFNPSVSEQKKIALTCKYVSLQLDRDLPSKVLYQWIQKKGRVIKQSITSFDIPKNSVQEVAVKFFRKLSPSSSESARVAFTLKYLDAQYGLSINSKQLFTWLSEKTVSTKKTHKR